MLLEFRLKNYRAFRTEAVFSLVASTDKTFVDENTTETGLAGVMRALRTAAVYGPNASGKTTLLRAIQLMRGVVVESAALKPDQTFNVQPFALDADAKREPTLFEATVLLNGVRHQYGFEFTPQRIVAEWLLVYQTKRPQRWIQRRYNSETKEETFEFSPRLTGSKRVWQDATRPNALFLSTAVQLNSEALQPLFQWFQGALHVFLDGGHIPHDFTTTMVERNEAQPIAAMLSAADIGIHSITVQRKKAFQRGFKMDLATGEVETTAGEGEIPMPKFRHVVGEISADFDYSDESQGTQKLYALAGPILDIVAKGSMLVIDELDRSLHPLLVHQLVRTFQDPEINTRGAQLIFTTHDTSLLDASLLRRDQIWFAEKDEAQSATLVPLTDFSPRKDEAFERAYLTGRYGGVPVLDRHLLPTRADAKR
jgi:uncharacterized protein